MDTLVLEVLLDLVSGRLASALPAHLAAAAAAYAENRASPPSPTVAPKDAVRIFEATRADDAVLAARAVSLLRVLAPTVIEADPKVTAAATSAASWDAWRALCTARDTATRPLFGMSHRELLHRLAGCPTAGHEFAEKGRTLFLPPKIEAWHATGPVVSERDVRAVWAKWSSKVAVGALDILTSETAHPRMFAIERGVRATVVLPAKIDSPAKMFAVMHELGHALLWLSPEAKEREWPRVIDEAAASYVAREMEFPINAWFDENAEPARERRTRLARTLAAIEQEPMRGGDAIAAKPPWALWHDPAMQAVYVAAESLADSLPTRMTGAELVADLTARATALDENHPLRQ